MKKLYTLIATVFLTASTFAQAPEKMSYQAVVRDAANTLITNQAVGMQISILQGGDLANPGPTIAYSETQTQTTNANGLVSLEIGTGNTTDDFTAIDWSAGPYFIQTGTDPTGGTTYTTLTSTSQLMSVPFALHTKRAANGLPAGGTDGQILAINASGAPEWITPSTGQTFYEDTDGDGYGDINSAFVANTAPNGYVDNNTDCDDNDITINPATVWYTDADGDGYGVSSTVSCTRPTDGFLITELTGTGTGTDDCDDTPISGAIIYPGAFERPGDGIDQDCDGLIDEISIGEIREGGMVFYVDSSGQHGLVVSLEDIIDPLTGQSYQWGSISCLNIIGTSAEFGSGQANTTKIVNDACQMTDGLISAAEACDSLVLAPFFSPFTYDDWFLPSRDELNLISSVVNSGIYPSGFDPIVDAISSTEYDIGYVWGLVYFNSYGKSLINRVRAVRAF